MTTSYVLVLALLAAMFAALRARARAASQAPPAAAARARRQPTRGARPAAPRASQPKVDANALQWEDRPVATPALGAALDETRALIRDRYIAARFPGLFRKSADLLCHEYVVQIARQYFEEGLLDRAEELFALAIEQSPQEVSMRLAQLEIAFLARDTKLFTGLARDLRALRPELPEWADVVRLGHALAPGETLFGAHPGAREHEHYGPWPDMPNWIQASWDLTAEVQAADFHRAMAERDRQKQRPTLRHAA